MSALLEAHLVLGWIVVTAFVALVVWGTGLLIRGRGLESSMRRLLFIASGVSTLEGLLGMTAYFASARTMSGNFLLGSIFLIIGTPLAYWSYPRAKSGQGNLLWMIFAGLVMIGVTFDVILSR